MVELTSNTGWTVLLNGVKSYTNDEVNGCVISDEVVDYPTRFQECASVYTYTDSRVKHPAEAAR